MKRFGIRLLATVVSMVLSVTLVSSVPAGAALSDTGEWGSVLSFPIVPIHMAITPEGMVLSFGSDNSSPTPLRVGNTHYDVWDPSTNQHILSANGSGTDLFCSLLVADPANGRLLTVGGDNGDPAQVVPVDEVTSYTAAGGFQNETSMLRDRWYASATTMPNGDIVVQGGIADFEYSPEFTPEVYRQSSGTWNLLSGANSDYAYGTTTDWNDPTRKREARWWYPRSWVAPNGDLFNISGSSMFYLDPTGTGTITPHQSFSTDNYGATSTAVMYRPGKILQVGGGDHQNNEPAIKTFVGSKLASIIDINGGAPVVTQAASMSKERHWADSTVLPDGDVLVTGGSRDNNVAGGLAYEAELWDPDTDTWTTLPQQDRMRLYHSTSILLPDGRILSAGGGLSGPQTNTNAEIFSPPYLFNGNVPAVRPTISSAPSQVVHGQNFNVQVSSDVTKFSFIRLGATTHSFDQGTRYMELTATGSGTSRTVTAPANGNVAPPGSYMLFALNAAGTPSVAAIIDIPVPGAPVDTVDPTVVADAPASPAASVTPTGTATDNVGVDEVNFSIEDLGTGQQLQDDLTTMGPANTIAANLANQGATSTAWSHSTINGLAAGDYRLTATSKDAAGNLSPPASQDFTIDGVAGPDRLSLLAQPCIVYDSRFAGSPTGGAWYGDQSREIQVAGTLLNQGGAASCIPADASAAVVRIASISPGRSGNLKIAPAGDPTGGAGVVNFADNNLNNTNTVTVPLTLGAVDIEANAGPSGVGQYTTEVHLDVIAYYHPAGTLKYVPLANPCAVLDTRPSMGADGTYDGPANDGTWPKDNVFPDVDVVGAFPAGQGGGQTDCGIPSSADAVLINLVAVGSSGRGHLSAGTGGQSPSSLVVTPFEDLVPAANNSATTIVAPDGAGKISIDVLGNAGAETKVRAVALGYYTDSDPSALDFYAVTACAAFDTRATKGASGAFEGRRQAGPGAATIYTVTGNSIQAAQGGEGAAVGTCGVPSGAEAVLINLVAVAALESGNYKVSQAGQSATGGVLNFNGHTPPMNNANAVVAPLSSSGQLQLEINGLNLNVDITHARGNILGYYN